MNSYKNTSPGKSKEYASNKIGEYKAPKPPAGASNSYEQVFRKLESKNMSAVNRDHYPRDKMANK